MHTHTHLASGIGLPTEVPIHSQLAHIISTAHTHNVRSNETNFVKLNAPDVRWHVYIVNKSLPMERNHFPIILMGNDERIGKANEMQDDHQLMRLLLLAIITFGVSVH